MSTANPTMYWQLAKQYFKRNNPVEITVMAVFQSIYNLITYRSRRKLLSYRKTLEMQKLERIERTLADSNPYDLRGAKINKIS